METVGCATIGGSRLPSHVVVWACDRREIQMRRDFAVVESGCQNSIGSF